MRNTTRHNKTLLTQSYTKNIAASVGLCLALGLSGSCFAEFYAGGSVGQSQWDDVGDSKGTSFDIFGGFQFSEFLAAEIAYTDAGSFKHEYLGDTFGTEIVGANYSLVVLLPLDDSITLKGKISYLDYTLDREIDGESQYKIQDGAVNYSLGIDINLVDNLYFDIEYRYYPLEFTLPRDIAGPVNRDVEIAADNVSLGLRFTF